MLGNPVVLLSFQRLMATQVGNYLERRRHDPEAEERFRSGHPKPVMQGTFRAMGLGLITGAADDDPSGSCWASPFLMLALMLITNSRKIMGSGRTPGR